MRRGRLTTASALLRRRSPFAALIVAGATLAGCAGFTGSPSHQVAEWANGADLSANDSYIVADVHDIAVGIAARRITAIHTACDGLATDAGTAYGELPTPDTDLTNDLNDAYLGFTNAAQKCSTTTSFSGRGFANYDREVDRAQASLSQADARLRHFGVH